MRFGWLAALSVILTASFSNAASAANWVRYTVSGHGDVTQYLFVGMAISDYKNLPNRALHISFAVDTEQAPSYSKFPNFDTFLNVDILTGDLSASASTSDIKYLDYLSLNASLPAFGYLDSFPILPGLYIANGLMNIQGNSFEVHGLIDTVRIEAIGKDEPYQFGFVPEPSTWLMLMVGISLLGTTLRRRQHPALYHSHV